MPPQFKVKFGGPGRGLIYEDEVGKLLFSWELAIPDGKKMIVYKADMTGDLKPIARDLPEVERSRIQLAHERVKQYVVSCGHTLYEEPEA